MSSSSSTPTPAFTYIELFCGIGGFRVALDAIGGRSVWSCDVESSSREVYAVNFSHSRAHPVPFEQPYHDVRRCDLARVPPYDILTAGFPCQDFSGLGAQRGLEGDRGALFWEIVRFLKAHRPRGFLLENVYGLLKMEDGACMRVVLTSLRECGYDVAYEVINSAVVVPQFRRRVYIVGVRIDADDATASSSPTLPFVFPTLPQLAASTFVPESYRGHHNRELIDHDLLCKEAAAAMTAAATPAYQTSKGTATAAATATTSTERKEQKRAAKAARRLQKREAVRRRRILEEAATKVADGDDAGAVAMDASAAPAADETLPRGRQRCNQPRPRTVGEVLESDMHPYMSHYRLSSRVWLDVKKSRSVERYGLRTRLVSPTDVADTLLASYRSSRHTHAQFVCRGSAPEQSSRVLRPRWFTPRECARLMGFPDRTRLHPHPVRCYEHLGNAVTPPVVTAVAASLVAVLFQHVPLRETVQATGAVCVTEVGTDTTKAATTPTTTTTNATLAALAALGVTSTYDFYRTLGGSACCALMLAAVAPAPSPQHAQLAQRRVTLALRPTSSDPLRSNADGLTVDAEVAAASTTVFDGTLATAAALIVVRLDDANEDDRLADNTPSSSWIDCYSRMSGGFHRRRDDGFASWSLTLPVWTLAAGVVAVAAAAVAITLKLAAPASTSSSSKSSSLSSSSSSSGGH